MAGPGQVRFPGQDKRRKAPYEGNKEGFGCHPKTAKEELGYFA